MRVMTNFEPLTPAQLKQSEDWAEKNTCPYPLGAYMETIREVQARIEQASRQIDEEQAISVQLQQRIDIQQARIEKLEEVVKTARVVNLDWEPVDIDRIIVGRVTLLALRHALAALDKPQEAPRCAERHSALPYSSDHLWNADHHGLPHGPCTKCGEEYSDYAARVEKETAHLLPEVFRPKPAKEAKPRWMGPAEYTARREAGDLPPEGTYYTGERKPEDPDLLPPMTGEQLAATWDTIARPLRADEQEPAQAGEGEDGQA